MGTAKTSGRPNAHWRLTDRGPDFLVALTVGA